MGYTEIYKEILEAVKKDNFPEASQVWAARRVAEALWQINLLINSPQSGSLVNTLDSIKGIVNNRFEEPASFK